MLVDLQLLYNLIQLHPLVESHCHQSLRQHFPISKKYSCLQTVKTKPKVFLLAKGDSATQKKKTASKTSEKNKKEKRIAKLVVHQLKMRNYGT